MFKDKATKLFEGKFISQLVTSYDILGTFPTNTLSTKHKF